MSIQYEKNNLVLGRGRVFFERFGATGFTGQGARYIGNTDLFNVTSNRTRSDNKVTRGGRVVLSGTEVVEETFTGVMTTDNVSLENVADWFSATNAGIITGAGIVTTTVKAYRGGYFQLGASQTNPAGRRGFTSVTATKGGNPVAEAGNYEVDLAIGLLRILPTATDIADGDDILFTGTTASLAEVILRPAVKAVRGSLRFISNATVGTSRDVFIPCVELRADGDQEMKGDKWQDIRFTFAAVNRPGYDLYYITKRATQ